MDKQLSEKIEILKSFSGDNLLRVALPLGGIGTGTVSLGGRGELRDWEIMNIPQKQYSTVMVGNEAPVFMVYTKDSQTNTRKTKALLGPMHDTEIDHYEGRGVNNHGFPRFRTASFSTSYPFGIVRLSDPTMPIEVNLVGYNPLIPGDADSSGIPIAILEYEIKNILNHPLEVSVCGMMRNFVGQDGSKNTTNWKGDCIPRGAVKNVNTYKQENSLKGIFMNSQGVNPESSAWGSIALSTDSNKSDLCSYRTSNIKGLHDWNDQILDIWDDFSMNGILTKREHNTDPKPLAALAQCCVLRAKQVKTFKFYITWHFPNRRAWDWSAKENHSIVGNYYCTQYRDAWDVIQKHKENIPSLTNKTLEFVNSFVSSSYPKEIKEAALFNVSTLRSQTVFRIADGHMFGWEGVMDRYGSCLGSCTHVWNYEQTTAFLFNSLAMSMRDIEFGYSTNAKGRMSFRTMLPLSKAQEFAHAAADGQMGCILKFYREWQLSGNNEFLKKYWEKVKAALSFAWIPGGWDSDKDGVMEGVQHNTMDVEYFGPNPQMQFWYLAALKAGIKMANALGDTAFAKICSRLFDYGSEWTDKHIFNGEYYYQKIEVPKSQKDIDPDLMVGMGTKNIKNPDYQLGEGCLVDQLVGQYMAHVLGLGYLVKKQNVKKALQSIIKYNFQDGFYDHFNNMRSYVMNDEKALIMASWPHKNRPIVPFPYWAEVMTGFEYVAGIGMLYEGMSKQGRQVIKNIRERYNGYRRNPFDETECGRHYARAMAAWAGILAESKFLYSGVEKSISVTHKAGKYFWSNGSAWGLCVISKEAQKYVVQFSVLHDKIELKKFFLGNLYQKVFQENKIIRESETITIEFEAGT